MQDETSIELRSKSPKGETVLKLRAAGADNSDSPNRNAASKTSKTESGFAQTTTVLRQLKENRTRLQMDNTILRAHR